jgi:DNA-binding MarR family transcriptional regulator
MTMNRTKASQDIMELFIQSVHKYKALEKIPSRTGANHDLFHSERHLLDMIGDNPGVNITDFARLAGITKGAVSQVVSKLENKGLVKRYKSSANDKEVFLELTRSGRDIYIQHKKTNEETLKPLIEKLEQFPDDKVEFLILMFRWINDYLEQEREHMKRHAGKGHR